MPVDLLDAIWPIAITYWMQFYLLDVSSTY